MQGHLSTQFDTTPTQGVATDRYGKGMTSMRNLLNDIVTLVNKDGRRHENIRASVQTEKIYIDDVTVPITAGDKIERTLPSAQEEVFLVTNAHLWSGVGSIKPYYEIAYEREGAQRIHSQRTAVNVHVSDSPQARVNLYSTDQSINVSNHQPEAVFSEIRDRLKESVANLSDLKLLLERVEDMDRSLENGDFKTAYKNFMAAAADHMTILAPVLPALAGLL